MKTILNLDIVSLLIALMLISFGCSSNRKSANVSGKFSKNELVFLDNNEITDPVTGYVWQYFNDNPTTFYRYKLDSKTNQGILPNSEQIIGLLEKVAFQLSSRDNPGNLKAVSWFDSDCDFLTSSSIKTAEGEILYEVVKWNAAARTLNIGNVTGGDLIVILLIKNK